MFDQNHITWHISKSNVATNDIGLLNVSFPVGGCLLGLMTPEHHFNLDVEEHSCMSLSTNNVFTLFYLLALSSGVVQWVERWTCDQLVVGSNPTRGKSCVTTLGKLFTPMCICHQAA